MKTRITTQRTVTRSELADIQDLRATLTRLLERESRCPYTGDTLRKSAKQWRLDKRKAHAIAARHGLSISKVGFIC